MKKIKIPVVCVLLLHIGAVVGQANNPPDWQNTLIELFRAGFNENTAINVALGKLQAQDPEGGPVIYSVSDNDYFQVDRANGVISLKRALDREVTPHFEVTFYATDITEVSVEVTYTVDVADYNDNAPQFDQERYEVRLSPGLPAREVIFNEIIVTDADDGPNAALSLRCYIPTGSNEIDFTIDAVEAALACGLFDIDTLYTAPGQYKGVVRLKQDLATSRNYLMSIQAQDQGNPSLSSVVTLSVIMGNDVGPLFLNAPLPLSIYENTAAGTSVGELRVRDSDLIDPKPIRIKIKSDPGGYFQVGSTRQSGNMYSADITVASPLDREDIGASYIFTVQAVELINGVESASRTDTTVTVTVLDNNDNRPTFSENAYVVTIPEGLPRDTAIPELSIIVNDLDQGDNAYFVLRLEGSQSNVLGFSPESGTGTVSASLLVREPLYFDYEVPDYRQQVFTIVARETRTADQFSSIATVTIILEDVNDNAPRFGQRDYTAYVREDRSPEDFITTITADDPDSGIFGQITYSLEGTDSNKFMVDAQTGDIFLGPDTLDFEEQRSYSFFAVAEDGGGASTTVPFKVEVVDFNDEGPVFSADQYRAFVSETSTELNPNVTVQAYDRESDFGVTYRIVAGNTPDAAFGIDAMSGFVFLKRPVGYEETVDNSGIIQLTVEASDNGNPPQTSTVPVIVQIRDENNHKPIFGQSIYYETVRETIPRGTSVLDVDATDADFGLNGEIGYVIRSGSKDNFVIDFDMGTLSVAPDADLTIEKYGSRYEMIVTAVDKGSPQQTSTALAIITVTDANNQIPQFTQDLYIFSVCDTVEVGTAVDFVTAKDSDSGSSIVYSMDPDYYSAKDEAGNPVTEYDPIDFRTSFRIDPSSGSISTNGELNRDYVAEVTFFVLARDVNAEDPAEQVGNATVLVSIRQCGEGGEGITFNPPWSTNSPTITITIPEEETVGTLITRVVAHDPVNNQQITDYHQVTGSDPDNFFIVQRDTGQIFLNKRMNYEEPATRQKSFQVEACTSAPDARCAIATVTVIAVDINDHTPEFLQPSYVFQASERLKYPAQFGVLIATDQDSGPFGSITYTLTGQGVDVFQIHPTLGYLYVAENQDLDRETVAQYNLIVRATDNPDADGGQRYSEVPVRVVVVDENDNSPEFPLSDYNMYTVEYVGRDTSLGQVRATDRDIGTNGIISYEITRGNDQGLFYIASETGVIRCRVELSGHSRDIPYTLTIKASDGGSPSLSTVTIVRIFISESVVIGRPEITYPPDGTVFEIPEDAQPGYNITTIEAEDKDIGPEGDLVYGFVPNPALEQDYNKFHIDPNTGRITLREAVDHEDKAFYDIVIVVRDQGDPPQETTRTIRIHVTDIDDNSPIFGPDAADACPDLPDLENPARTSVREEQPSGVFVIQVQACDADSPPLNAIYYFILCGNGPDPGAFRIEKDTGKIFTNQVLDREVQAEYDLCIFASSEPNPNVTVVESAPPGERRKRQTAIDDSVLHVLISVEDVNDNLPDFGGGAGAGGAANLLVTSVVATARLGTDLIKMSATDRDGSGLTYSLNNITFVSSLVPNAAVTYAFVIDAESGVVSTNFDNYEDYIGGYFSMLVWATDPGNNRAQAVLQIFVVAESQQLRFTFNMAPEDTHKISAEFFTKLNAQLPAYTRFVPDSLHYSIDIEGKEINKSDICFHTIRNQQVMDRNIAMNIANDAQGKAEVQYLYDEYKMESIDVCDPHVTTMWWSGYWWLWWILIALAVFIFLLALICIICVLCFWPKYYKHVKHLKPYVVIDPIHLAPSYPEYEWQEHVVKME